MNESRLPALPESHFRPNEELKGLLQDIRVVEYRGLKDLSLTDVGRVNLIVGTNNSGKTSLLEALYLLARQTDTAGFRDISELRDESFLELCNSKGGRFQAEARASRGGQAISLHLVLDRRDQRAGEVEFGKFRVYLTIDALQGSHDQSARASETTSAPSGEVTWNAGVASGGILWVCRASLAVTYRNDFLRWHMRKAFDASLAAGTKETIVEFIREHLDPGVRNVEIDSQQRFYVTHDGFEVPQPLSSFGEGFRRILYLSLLVALSRGGLLLIDEIEVGIHVSLFKPFARFLHELAARFEVQIFATTHSQETIEAFLDDPHKPEDIVAYVLRKEEGRIVPERFAGTQLAKLIEMVGYDIRRYGSQR